MTTKVVDWGLSEVSAWLQTLGLSQYIEGFHCLGIDGPLLSQMTDDDLKADLGVKVRLHRVKILDHLQRLRTPESEACDPEISLKAIEGPLMNNVFILGKSGASIGRNTCNDVYLNETFVSRVHGQIVYNEGGKKFSIEDLGSTTGTFIMMRQRLELTQGLIFQLGTCEFLVETCNRTSLSLEVIEGPCKGAQVTVSGPTFSLGRGTGNDFSVREDLQMSSSHSQITHEAGKFYLSDLNSTNKTWQRLSGEGKTSEPFELDYGDALKIGATVFHVQRQEAPSLELDSASEHKACKICFTHEADVAFYPCGHVCCSYCSSMVNNCPFCKAKPQDILRLYK
jgi:pSer/pThr/pTyr-binding forkhead associated (FHA) protein